MSRLADRKQRRFRRGVFWAIVAALAGYALLAGDHRPHHLLVLWLEERRTETRIAELEAEYRALESRRDRFESDPAALEALAREKGLMRPGDMVYRIVRVPEGIREAMAESLAARSDAAPESLPSEPIEGPTAVPGETVDEPPERP